MIFVTAMNIITLAALSKSQRLFSEVVDVLNTPFFSEATGSTGTLKNNKTFKRAKTK